MESQAEADQLGRQGKGFQGVHLATRLAKGDVTYMSARDNLVASSSS